MKQRQRLLPSVREPDKICEPRHEISNNVVCVTCKGSDQPAHTCSLIKVFASFGLKLFTDRHTEDYPLIGTPKTLISLANAQADLSFCFAQTHFVGFVTMSLCVARRLRSAYASAQSGQSLCCSHEESLSPNSWFQEYQEDSRKSIVICIIM